MSDLDSRRAPAPPFSTSVRPAIEADEDGAAGLERDAPRGREGLPPGFRMRHDAHYVDQLAARAPVPQVRAVPVRDIDARGGTSNAHDLEPLSRSIARHGVLQPLHVRARHGRYELIAGARRLGAAALAGLTEVPCIVHACDDPHARAIAEADNLRTGTPQLEAAAPDAVRAGFDELRRSFGTIESCLHLVDTRAASLRDRVALDIIRAEATRASRLVRCLATLGEEPVLAARQQPLRRIVEQVLATTESERRLAGVEVSLAVAEGLPTAAVDDDAFAVAIEGALGATIALVQGTREAAVRVDVSATQASVAVELTQRSVRVPASFRTRFFDPQWTERPGGYQAAIEAATARRLIAAHGGRTELVLIERGGCRLVIVIPLES